MLSDAHLRDFQKRLFPTGESAVHRRRPGTGTWPWTRPAAAGTAPAPAAAAASELEIRDCLSLSPPPRTITPTLHKGGQELGRRPLSAAWLRRKGPRANGRRSERGGPPKRARSIGRVEDMPAGDGRAKEVPAEEMPAVEERPHESGGRAPPAVARAPPAVRDHGARACRGRASARGAAADRTGAGRVGKRRAAVPPRPCGARTGTTGSRHANQETKGHRKAGELRGGGGASERREGRAGQRCDPRGAPRGAGGTGGAGAAAEEGGRPTAPARRIASGRPAPWLAASQPPPRAARRPWPFASSQATAVQARRVAGEGTVASRKGK